MQWSACEKLSDNKMWLHPGERNLCAGFINEKNKKINQNSVWNSKADQVLVWSRTHPNSVLDWFFFSGPVQTADFTIQTSMCIFKCINFYHAWTCCLPFRDGCPYAGWPSSPWTTASIPPRVMCKLQNFTFNLFPVAVEPITSGHTAASTLYPAFSNIDIL